MIFLLIYLSGVIATLTFIKLYNKYKLIDNGGGSYNTIILVGEAIFTGLLSWVGFSIVMVYFIGVISKMKWWNKPF